MNGHDDMNVLGEYFAEFSDAGSVPTSLGGYGYGQQRHRTALGATPAQAAAAEPEWLPELVGKKTPAKTAAAQPARPAAAAAKPAAQSQNADWLAAEAIKADMAKRQAAEKRGVKYGSVTRTADGKFVRTKPQIKVGNAWVPAERVPVRDVRAALKSLGYPIATGYYYGTDLGATWLQYVKHFGEKRASLGESPDSNAWLFMQPGAKATLSAKARAAEAGGKKAPRAPAARPAASQPARPSTATPTPAAKTVTVGTHEIQSILKRLGYKAIDPKTGKDRLGDGKTGPTTEGAWKESAAKRNLDPSIRRATPALTSVIVNERTYLLLKADADAKVSPDATQKTGESLLSLPPSVVAIVSPMEVGRVLAALGVAQPKSDAEFVAAWENQAKKRGLDPRMEQSGDKLVVLRKTWDTLQEAAEPKEPAPGPQKDAMAEAVANIVKQSTASVKANTIRTAFNAAIKSGVLTHAPLKSGSWEGSLRPLVIDWLGIQDKAAREVWSAALVKGKLVSGDGKKVKLPPAQAKSFEDAAAKLKTATKEEKGRLKGFTEANPAEVISAINKLGVSTKKFDVSGGPKELADAIKTFFENTGTKAPGGDTVRGADGDKKIYVRTSVLVALSEEAKRVKERADATKQFRDAMVTNALKESTASMSVKDFQQAIAHTVLSAKAGKGRSLTEKEKKLYPSVKVTGAFDKATRAAFTNVAQTLTIGPAVQQLQGLLQKQLGPRFKKKLVEEARSQVWNQYLNNAVGGTPLSIKTLPILAAQVEQFARLYEQNVGVDTQRKQEATAQKKVLADAVGKSKFILSVFEIQEALLEMAQPGRTVAQTVVKPTGVKLTAVADKATRDGLLQLSSLIFPSGYSLPETMWMAYLKEVGISVENGRTGKTWRGATYLALPQALADILAKNAGAWEAKFGRHKVSSKLAPLPLKDEALLLRFNRPTVVTATVVQKQVITEPEQQPAAPGQPEPKKKKTDASKKAASAAAKAAAKAAKKAEKAARKQAEAEAAERLAQQNAEDARLRAEADRLRQEANSAYQEAQSAAGEAQAAQDVATQAGGAEVTGPTITGPQITGPNIQITVPQQEPTTVQAGMGAGGWLAGGAIGLLALLLASKSDNPESKTNRTERSRMNHGPGARRMRS